ncbi:MAG: hypothetical protein GY796_31295, partial [Chloroflexi bacterium]|nr:hypothetical protein [Chloroflexota bacterium]
TFQLSPDNTALVYVHNNQLIMTDAFGKNRQILVTGQPYPSDDDDVPGVSPWHMKDAIHSPMWAPTGDKIAFVMGGVQLIQTDSVPNGIEPKMIQPNIPKPCEDCGSVTPVYLARPESWSPNGRFLTIQQTLVAVHAEEWATAVADLETDTVIFPPFSSSAAHYTIWKPDSSTAYIWNDHDFYDGYPSSLELYDPIMQTVTPIITNSRNWGEIGEHYRWLRYPMLTAGGELYFFFNHEPEFPQWPPTFTLMKTTERFWETGELSDLTTVFPHTLPISYVKWAPQHEGALLYLDTDDQSESSKKVENWYWLSLIDDGLAPLNLPEKCHFITWPK